MPAHGQTVQPASPCHHGPLSLGDCPTPALQPLPTFPALPPPPPQTRPPASISVNPSPGSSGRLLTSLVNVVFRSISRFACRCKMERRDRFYTLQPVVLCGWTGFTGVQCPKGDFGGNRFIQKYGQVTYSTPGPLRRGDRAVSHSDKHLCAVGRVLICGEVHCTRHVFLAGTFILSVDPKLPERRQPITHPSVSTSRPRAATFLPEPLELPLTAQGGIWRDQLACAPTKRPVTEVTWSLSSHT